MRILKKVISILVAFLMFFIIYFLQLNFFNWFNIAGVKPNLFIVLILCIGLFMGKRVAIPLGFVIGMYIDLLTKGVVGVSAISFCLIGFVASFFKKNFSKDGKITFLLMVGIGTFIYELVICAFSVAKNLSGMQIFGCIKILFIEVLFNVLLTIILYPLICKIGELLDDVFGVKKIKTRYL